MAHSPRFRFSVPPPCASGWILVPMGLSFGNDDGSRTDRGHPAQQQFIMPQPDNLL